jgi:hypothetical protein
MFKLIVTAEIIVEGYSNYHKIVGKVTHAESLAPEFLWQSLTEGYGGLVSEQPLVCGGK